MQLVLLMNEIKIQLLGYLFQNEGIFVAFRKLDQKARFIGNANQPN